MAFKSYKGSVSQYIFYKHRISFLFWFIFSALLLGVFPLWLFHSDLVRIFKTDVITWIAGSVIFIFFVNGFFSMRKDSMKNIAQIACPKCEGYIDLYNWDCPCGHFVIDNHIIAGCSVCGTKYGSGYNKIRSINCQHCSHELNFFEPYKFYNWSVLAKGEITDKEYIVVPRQSNIYTFIGFGIIISAVLLSFFVLGTDPNKIVKIPVLWRALLFLLGVLGAIFITLSPLIVGVLGPQGKLVKNPKYKGRNNG
jgi:DNA-directed RNA polymerase subunit RPC12/RpoP